MLYVVIAAVVALAAIALVLIHNHQAVANASAKLDAVAIKVDPVIRASEADVAGVVAQVQTAAASIDPHTATANSADVAGSQPAAPAQVQ